MLYSILKVLFTPVFRVAFRIRIEGAERVPRRGPVILAANHQSFSDSLFLPFSVKRRLTFLAKAEYFDDWRTSWFYRGMGQIPIRRGAGTEGLRALGTAEIALARGDAIALYPEGTRSDDGFVHRGQKGAARLALMTGALVIPVGLSGTARVQPVGSRWLRPFTRVEIHFGEPRRLLQGDVERAGSERTALRDFTDQLMAELASLSGLSYVDTLAGRGAAGSSQSRNQPET
jgi:1-acyl-sn-glycerol-3-phosphate acyltransferase